MSKQAKDKKAVERSTQKTSIDEFQIPEVNPLALVGVAGFVGAVVYYKYFYKESGEIEEVETPESKTLDPTKPDRSRPQGGTREGQPKEKPKRRELDTLD